MTTAATGVTVVGSTNLDTTLRVPHIPQAGETILSSEQHVAPGGKGANQAAAAAWHGGMVRFVSGTGTDDAADLALENLRALGVELSGIQRFQGTPTGSAVLLVAADAENLIVVSPGANLELESDHVSAELSRETPLVLLTQLETPLEVVAACAARDSVRWRVLNPAPASSDARLAKLLPGFNILIPNRTELGQLSGGAAPSTLPEVTECVRALSFAGTVIVTLGASGAAVYLEGSDMPLLIKPPVVTPQDTSGAGDVFCGVFAAELAVHGSVELAVEIAVRVSAGSTEQVGAQLTSATRSVPIR